MEEIDVHLAAQVYESLVHAPRRQQLELLSLLFKHCPASALAPVREHAFKIGAISLHNGGRFQRSDHRTLDAIFSFLDVASLRSAETACVLWRNACMDFPAGWPTALASAVVNEQWVADLTRHRIDPSRLVACTAVVVQGGRNQLRKVLLMPNVRSLRLRIDMPEEPAETADNKRGAPWRTLFTVNSSTPPHLRILSAFFSGMLTAPMRDSLTTLILDSPCPADVSRALTQLPNLTTLHASSFGCPFNGESFPSLTELSMTHTERSSVLFAPKLRLFTMRHEVGLTNVLNLLRSDQLPDLHSLVLSHVVIARSPLSCFGEFTTLTNLHLDELYARTARPASDFLFLASLTNLTHLRLGLVFFPRDTPANLFANLSKLQSLRMHVMSRFPVSWLGLNNAEYSLQTLIIAELDSNTRVGGLHSPPSVGQEQLTIESVHALCQFQKLQHLHTWFIAPAHRQLLLIALPALQIDSRDIREPRFRDANGSLRGHPAT